MARFMRLTTAGPSYTKPVYSCTKDAPAASFSCTSAGVCMPPTPTIGKAALLCVCKYEMTSVLRFVNGFPLNPPACSVSSVLLFNPSRDRVVLVAITPSIWVSATISIISSNCELLKSELFLAVWACVKPCRCCAFAKRLTAWSKVLSLGGPAGWGCWANSHSPQNNPPHQTGHRNK